MGRPYHPLQGRGSIPEEWVGGPSKPANREECKLVSSVPDRSLVLQSSSDYGLESRTSLGVAAFHPGWRRGSQDLIPPKGTMGSNGCWRRGWSGAGTSFSSAARLQ